MTRLLHVWVQDAVLERDRPDCIVDRFAEILDRYTESLDRTEQPDKRDWDVCTLLLSRDSGNFPIQSTLEE